MLKVVSFSFIVCLIKEMFRLLLCSPHVARFHVRGVSIVSEHARSIQRGKLTSESLVYGRCGKGHANYRICMSAAVYNLL